MTTDDISTDDNGEVRTRMRKRFQELDELQRKREEAGAAWVFVGYFGFLITFIGAFLMLFFIGIIPLTLEIFLATGVILFGTFLIAIACFLRNSPNIVMAEL
ncbi:MAG: hypothetical protein P1Q69_20805 [Candidatus Thorarchaeota archaeon]|nr:hypothetical protein [Candidatus Thorarchaeota archaeon]